MRLGNRGRLRVSVRQRIGESVPRKQEAAECIFNRISHELVRVRFRVQPIGGCSPNTLKVSGWSIPIRPHGVAERCNGKAVCAKYAGFEAARVAKPRVRAGCAAWEMRPDVSTIWRARVEGLRGGRG